MRWFECDAAHLDFVLSCLEQLRTALVERSLPLPVMADTHGCAPACTASMQLKNIARG